MKKDIPIFIGVSFFKLITHPIKAAVIDVDVGLCYVLGIIFHGRWHI